MRIRPGIYFADDPAFKGRQRELVAQDYVYAFQRVVDPANISPIEANVIDLKIKGLAAARDAAVKGKKPFDYDAPIEGLRAIDRHTLRIELDEPRPRFIDALVQSDLLGGQAREVVEHYREAIGEHPVGTGPSSSRAGAALAHRAGTQPGLPRGAVRRRPAATMRKARPWSPSSRAAGCR